MSSRHILFVTDSLYTPNAGAEGVLRRIVRRLPRDRYGCSIATLASQPERVAHSAYDCPVHVLPMNRLWDWTAVRTAWRLARLIRVERVSVVHTFFEASDLLGGVVAKLSGCPALVSGRRDMGFRRTRAHRIAYRLAAPLFDQVHAVAEEVRRSHIQQDHLDPRRVVTVENGVDLDEIDSTDARRPRDIGIEESSPVVVCVANVRPVKGIEHLVRTAVTVCRQRPQVRFLVVGDLQDQDYFRGVTNLARELAVEQNIVFAGCRTDVAAILKTSDVFYLPSLSEGMSNALLEAMACGLPCVATRVGGNPGVVDHGRSGYLVPVKDEKEAAQRILELLGDRVQAGHMGRAGRAIVKERFTVESMVRRLVELYDGLLCVPREALPRQVELGGLPANPRG